MEQGMSPGGWLMLIVAWGSIISLTAFCFSRVLRSQGSQDKE
jgi:hypothetical protein